MNRLPVSGLATPARRFPGPRLLVKGVPYAEDRGVVAGMTREPSVSGRKNHHQAARRLVIVTNGRMNIRAARPAGAIWTISSRRDSTTTRPQASPASVYPVLSISDQ